MQHECGAVYRGGRVVARCRAENMVIGWAGPSGSACRKGKVNMKYPMDVEMVLKAFRMENNGASAEAEAMLAAVIRLANSTYEDGYKAGRADAEKNGKAVI